MDEHDAMKFQFFKMIEASFKVRVLTEEDIVFGLLKGETYSKYGPEEWKETEICWVYDSAVEGRALALGISKKRLADVLRTLECQGRIMKHVDGDFQGGAYPKYAVVPRHLQKVV